MDLEEALVEADMDLGEDLVDKQEVVMEAEDGAEAGEVGGEADGEVVVGEALGVDMVVVAGAVVGQDMVVLEPVVMGVLEGEVVVQQAVAMMAEVDMAVEVMALAAIKVKISSLSLFYVIWWWLNRFGCSSYC